MIDRNLPPRVCYLCGALISPDPWDVERHRLFHERMEPNV